MGMTGVLGEGSYRVHVWLNLATGFFSKAQATFDGDATDGKPIKLGIHTSN
jgi:hypothetical protein